MLEKLNELRQLNEKFYDMYGRLYKNRKLLDNSKTVEFFGKQLFEQYKAEYEALKYKYEIEELPELETVKQRHSELVPRYHRPWYFLFLVKRPNRALKNIERAIYCEIEQHFRNKEAALKRLEDALDKKESADQRTKIFDEPPEEPDEQTPAEPATEPKAQPTEKPDKPAAKAAKEKKPEPTGQAPGQITLDDVQAQTEPKKQ